MSVYHQKNDQKIFILVLLHDRFLCQKVHTVFTHFACVFTHFDVQYRWRNRGFERPGVCPGTARCVGPHVHLVNCIYSSWRPMPEVRIARADSACLDCVVRNAGDPNRRIVLSSADGQHSERRTWSEHVRVLSGVPVNAASHK